MQIEPHFLEDLDRERYELTCAPLTPSSLRRYFLLLIRSHFSDPANYGSGLEHLACLRYAPEGDASGTLQINLSGGDNDEATEIIIHLREFGVEQKVFDDITEEFYNEAKTIRTMPASCKLLVRHVSPSIDLALDMGWSTLCFLLGFKEKIMEEAQLTSFHPVTLGPPGQEEKQPDPRFRVDLLCVLNFNCSVATVIESHKLKTVTTEFTETLPP